MASPFPIIYEKLKTLRGAYNSWFHSDDKEKKYPIIKDNLARKTYAEKIATEIAEHYASEEKAVKDKQKEEKENIIFAISAKWGEGKTTLLDLLETPLTEKKFKVIKFNPWKYSQEDITLKRAFLCTIKEQLESSVNLDDLYYDRTRTILSDNWKRVILPVIIIFVVLLIIWIVFQVCKLPDWMNITINSTKNFLSSFIMTSTITAVLVALIIKVMTFNVKTANVSTAEQFEKKFNELLKEKKKLVIFIDDLDRCNPKTVKVILDSLKTFFQHPECSYIITGDHTVIERYAGNELGLPAGTSESKKLYEGRRFIKKLFDVYWRLPLPTPYYFDNFIDCEIKNSKIKISPQQSASLKSFLKDDGLFERNPRHVKRFLTMLRFALESVNLQRKEVENIENEIDSKNILYDILDNPDLLAKVLLIEEFFYPMYEKLILHPEELLIHEKHLRSGGKSDELIIAGKQVLLILDKDKECLENYASLVKKPPKFTDESNITLHEVASYFSFSGSTGLPSLSGPDESNFEQYIKSGHLVDKLGSYLDHTMRERNQNYASKAIELFDKATDQIEKQNIVREALKLSLRRDEWTDEISIWEEKLFTLNDDQQNQLAVNYWSVVFQKEPKRLAEVKNKKPKYFDLIWALLKDKEIIDTLNPDIAPELVKIIKDEISTISLNLKNAEMYLQIEKFDPKEIENEINTKLSDPDTCKKYLEHMKEIGFSESKVSDITIKKLRNFLSNFDNLDWVITNRDFLKSINLFDLLHQKLTESIKNSKELIKIADQKDVLELTDDEKKLIAGKIPQLIKKSADVQFLNNSNVQSILDKDNKIISFRKLQDVLGDTTESLEKRKEVAEMLIKNSTIWNDIETDDIYEQLKEFKKLKQGGFQVLKGKQKEILDSWGYDESGKKIANKKYV
ncbi:MAG: P-loop NTPase fold protein [Deltaproteobacteria bacterium]|nr:P-loop NTPase fold protein [Deltaproteobacteria bacterium]